MYILSFSCVLKLKTVHFWNSCKINEKINRFIWTIWIVRFFFPPHGLLQNMSLLYLFSIITKTPKCIATTIIVWRLHTHFDGRLWLRSTVAHCAVFFCFPRRCLVIFDIIGHVLTCPGFCSRFVSLFFRGRQLVLFLHLPWTAPS